MITIRCLFFIIGLVFLACKSNTKETPDGLRFRVIKEGKGDLAKKNDVVLFHLKVIDSKDSIWVNSYDNGIPLGSLTGDPKRVRESPLKKMFRMVRPDDSIIVNLTLREYYRYMLNQPPPLNVNSSLVLSYQVKIDRIIPVEAHSTWMEILSFRNKKKSNRR